MKRCAWLLLVALSAVPAASDDKKKDEKKGKEAAQAPVVVDPVKDAEAKLAAGDADGAIKVLEGAMATNGAAALKLGVLRESRGELDVAVDAYKAASATLTGAAKGEALGRMSVAQDDRGMSEAGATADAAVAADPEGVWPTIAMARRRSNEGKPDEAIALAQKAVGAGGGAPATAALARAQESKGDMAAAEASYKQAIAADAKSISATVGLATVLRKTGRAAEAEPMLAKLIDAQPGAVAAYKEMARVKIAQGRAQDALADANIAAAMSEGDADAKELVAEVRVASAMQSVAAGQVDVAVADLMRLRDENPSSAAVRIGLAKAQIARRDAASAITELQKAVELDPKNAEAHYQLGTVLLRMKGDAASAVTAYQKAVELEPGNAAYATSLGTALVGRAAVGAGDRPAHEAHGAAGLQAARGLRLARAGVRPGQALQGSGPRAREGDEPRTRERGRLGDARLGVLRHEGRGEVQGDRGQGAHARLQGAEPPRLPEEDRGRHDDQVGGGTHARGGSALQASRGSGARRDAVRLVARPVGRARLRLDARKRDGRGADSGVRAARAGRGASVWAWLSPLAMLLALAAGLGVAVLAVWNRRRSPETDRLTD